ncbi:hypothetical protein FEM33_10220 [Dyadobacter flavalbus]|uniref:Uncharacterized protein n=1 Tax=Dyadobacter flavalbus TaxID=2579942 RepID=A0A5M8QZW3_9BACT|nr:MULTISPECIES: hypothetical protein [Dyadobacter]KAA6439933.1 hypothetical protein FEM33_10220 [Dyadobacter flavalbus]
MTNYYLSSPTIDQNDVLEEYFSFITLDHQNDNMNPEIFEKLDAIYEEPEALRYYYKIVFSMCLKLIVLHKFENGELTQEEFDQQSKKPSEKNLMEPYGLSYLQYRALKDAKGTGPNMLTLKRTVDRLGYSFDKILYSEKVIKVVSDELEKIKNKNRVMNGLGLDIKPKK